MTLPRIPIENWSDRELLSAAYEVIAEMEKRMLNPEEFGKMKPEEKVEAQAGWWERMSDKEKKSWLSDRFNQVF